MNVVYKVEELIAEAKEKINQSCITTFKLNSLKNRLSRALILLDRQRANLDEDVDLNKVNELVCAVKEIQKEIWIKSQNQAEEVEK